ncbi:MAG: FAD-dependent oxidoreductase [Candidatus Omnitrophica bacterium]|nr:FAD-dependent oxidoreductase [Candidatus Omnitrophota bacterium]
MEKSKKKKYVVEPERKVEVAEEADVVVIGGGPGGFPAAIAAARQGCKTLIVERYGLFGGLATTGLMGPIFGFAWGDPKKSILGGIPLEVIRGLQKIGGALDDKNIRWDSIRFDPELLKHVIDGMLLEAGVKILLHSLAVGIAKQGDRIDSVILENKSGRMAVRGKVFIDATGDGDLGYWAGCAYTKGRPADGRMQSMGTKFRIGGVEPMTDEEEKYYAGIVKKAMDEKKIPAYHAFFEEISENGVTLRKGEITPTVTRCPGDATNVYDLTRAELKIRKDTLEIVDFYRKNVKGYKNCYLIDTPVQMGIRETRQILGGYVLNGADVMEGRRFPDKIARGCWFMDIHCPLGLWSSKSNLCSQKCAIEPPCIMKQKYYDQLYPETCPPAGSYYDIPYRCIVPEGTGNLLVSGRPISADHGGMSSARVIGTCMAIGEAAGIAAYLASSENKTPKVVVAGDIQKILEKNGVPL